MMFTVGAVLVVGLLVAFPEEANIILSLWVVFLLLQWTVETILFNRRERKRKRVERERREQWMRDVRAEIAREAAWRALRAREQARMRAKAHMPPPPPPPSRTTEQVNAARELGVPVDASKTTIMAAYKRMIRIAHPDLGGSVARAQAINRAKDILLKNIT